MAFVTCGQHKTSQEAQDAKIKELQDNALTAEDALLDKNSSKGGGKITAEKIKEAIAGDVAVSVKENSGIKGNGTKADPLTLNLGDTLKVDEDGKLNLNPTAMTARIVDAAGRVIGYGVNQGA